MDMDMDACDMHHSCVFMYPFITLHLGELQKSVGGQMKVVHSISQLYSVLALRILCHFTFRVSRFPTNTLD